MFTLMGFQHAEPATYNAKRSLLFLFLNGSLKVIELCALVCRWELEWQEDKQMDFYMVCLPNGWLLQRTPWVMTTGAPQGVSKAETVTSQLKAFISQIRPLKMLLECAQPSQSQGISVLKLNKPAEAQGVTQRYNACFAYASPWVPFPASQNSPKQSWSKSQLCYHPQQLALGKLSDCILSRSKRSSLSLSHGLTKPPMSIAPS